MKKLTLILLTICLFLTACGRRENKKGTTTTMNTSSNPPSSITSPTSVPTQTVTSTTTTATTTTTAPDPGPTIDLPADAINVVEEWGILSGEGHAASNSLSLITHLLEISNGSTVYFPQGTYELSAPLFLVGKTDIHIIGDNATFIRSGVTNTAAKQSPSTDPVWPEEIRNFTASSSVFVVTECENITFEGLTIEYAIPTSLSGKITAISGGSLTIEIIDGAPITGNEYVTVVNSFTKDGIADRTFEQYASSYFPVEKISDNLLRVSGLSAGGLTNLSKGRLVCLRLSTSSDYVFNVSKTTQTTFKTITIHNSLNGGIIMTDRCKDAYLKDVRVLPKNNQSLMSTNADILHIAALEGELTVLDCHFEKPGDDCINVHDMAYTVENISGQDATISAPRFSFNYNWGKAGDVIEFFDSVTFASLGTATIVSTQGKQYTFDAIPQGVKAGTVISNYTMHPSVTIRNTTVMNNRARGFLLQTDNVTVENCTFQYTALAAILIAPDLDYWYEMSPARNVTIQNNTFINCGTSATGTIQLSTDHDTPQKLYTSYIHSDITIAGNTFTSRRVPALTATCVQNLTFTGNTFESFIGNFASLTFCRKVTLDEEIVERCLLTNVTELES